MKKIVREYIREQVKLIFEADVDPLQAIKDKEAEISAAEQELENDKKAQNNARLQQQNKQKVTSTQVGTLGDTKSKDIKTKDVKRDIELFRAEFDNLKNKIDTDVQSLDNKKAQLDAEKARLTSSKVAAAPTASAAPSAPTTPSAP